MAEFLASMGTEILAQAYIFNSRIMLEVENSFRSKTQKMADLFITGIPEVAIVTRVFDKNFMRSDSSHAVINAISAAAGLALDVIERCRMHYGARGP